MGTVGRNIGVYGGPDVKAISGVGVVFNEEADTGWFFQVLYSEPPELAIVI